MTNNPQSEYMQGVYCPICDEEHPAETMVTTAPMRPSCSTCGETCFVAWNDKGECIKCARDRIRDTPETPQVDELQDFIAEPLAQLVARYNDKDGREAYDSFIAALRTWSNREKNEAVKQELGRLSQLAKRHPNFVALANTIDNRLKELEETK